LQNQWKKSVCSKYSIWELIAYSYSRQATKELILAVLSQLPFYVPYDELLINLPNLFFYRNAESIEKECNILNCSLLFVWVQMPHLVVLNAKKKNVYA
jgi:hypothetical protein